jgi:hypothetical protein
MSVRIEGIEHLHFSSPRLWGAWLDCPVAPVQHDGHDFELCGWALGRGKVVVAVEVVLDDPLLRDSPYWLPAVIQSIRVNYSRPDVAERFPQEPISARSGFRCMISTTGLPQQFDLLLRAVLGNGKRAPFAVIRGTRQSVVTTYEPRHNPAVVTFLGRSGSTWIMRLLADHPAIVTYGGYPYEAQVSAHWAHMFHVLTRSAERNQADHLRGCFAQPDWVGPNPFYVLPEITDSGMHSWFAQAHPAMLAEFCQRSVDSFYRQAARASGRESAKYFLEKWGLGSPHEPLNELFPGMKEIILVRDPRDVICSVFSFNAKRGYSDFGRQYFDNDCDYIDSQGVVVRQLLHRVRRRGAQACVVRYEELVQHPEATLAEVLHYLELEHSPQIIRGMIERASIDGSLEGHRTAADPGASIGRWQRDLDEETQARCQEAFAEVLQAFDYR